MILKAIIEDQEYTLNVPDNVIEQGRTFFAQLDRDMADGWQMSRDWVQEPDREQRCQIVADKLLSALEKENPKVGMLMAGYILDRLPGVEAVELDITGEIQNNRFRFRTTEADSPPAAVAVAAEADVPGGLSRMEAMAQAGNDVTKVFKVGKAWRFSVYDHASGTWHESPLIAGQQEAERLRQLAFKERYEALQRGADDS